MAPIFGIVGVVFGVATNEWLRRINRREFYAPKIFEKRLSAYEKLAALINKGGNMVHSIIDTKELTYEERHLLISNIIQGIAQHCDKNNLYIDQELSAHCTALFMGIEDVGDITEAEAQETISHYYSMRIEALRMISEDSGIAQINKLFKSINRPTIKGAVIERIRELKREKRKEQRS